MNNETVGSQNRWIYFLFWVLTSLALFYRVVFDLSQLAWHDDTASHILLIPFLSAWLLFSEPRPIQPNRRFAVGPASVFLAAALLAVLFAVRCDSCSGHDRLSAETFALVLLIVAGFVCFLGVSNAKRSSFALGFLLFAVPIPELILNKIIYWLQAGSAAVAEAMFNLSGAPVLRDGFVFRLPKMSIEVAQECSGIRSSLALLILALLVAYFSFRPFWKKAVFVAAGLAMMVVKNGIRIATLTLLANYVNPDFIYGRLHRQGGVVFFLIALGLLWPLYWYLRKGEDVISLAPRRVGVALPAGK